MSERRVGSREKRVWIAVCLLANALSPAEAHAWDCSATVTENTRCCAWSAAADVPVTLNAASFTTDTWTQTQLERVVVRVVDEWNQRGAASFTLRYAGRDDMTTSAAGTAAIQIWSGPWQAIASGVCDPSPCTAECDLAMDGTPTNCCSGGNCTNPDMTYPCRRNYGCLIVMDLDNPDCDNWCDLGGIIFSDNFTFAPADPANGIDFWGVLTHELGHKLGHLHRDSGGGDPDAARCSVMSYPPSLGLPLYKPETMRGLWKADIEMHRDDPIYGYGVETGRTVWGRDADSLAGPWTWQSSGEKSNIEPAITFVDGTNDEPAPAYCAAYAAADAPYGVVDHILTMRHDGSSWEFSHPNPNLFGFSWAVTHHGLAVGAGEDHFEMAWIDSSTADDQFEILTASSTDCRSWTFPSAIAGAQSRRAPDIAYDYTNDSFLLLWNDAETGELFGAVKNEYTGGWSAPQALFWPSALGPSLSHTFGGVGAANYVAANDWGQIATFEIWIDSSGVIQTSSWASYHSSSMWARDALGGSYGYDWGVSGWRYVLTLFDRDLATGTNRITAYTKTSPDPSVRYTSGQQMASGSSGPATSADLVWSFAPGFYEFRALMSW